MNLTVLIMITLAVLTIFIFYLLTLNNQKKFVEQVDKISSKLVSDLQTNFSSSINFLQTQINNTINQMMLTDNTLRTQLELLRNSINEQFSSTIKNLNLQIKTSTDTTVENMALITQQISEKLKDTGEIFSNIKQTLHTLGKLETITEQLRQQNEEIRKSLGSIHLRGSFGELLLKKLLLNIFPEEIVRFQYQIDPYSSEKVDAAILIYDKVIPIDSKFNLEKFLQLNNVVEEKERKKILNEILRNIKEQIDDIHDKYVKPQYGADFAFMYIPSETVFIEVINLADKSDSIFSYAMKKHVVIASPQTLFPYLQLVLIGLQSKRISDNIMNLRQQITDLVISVGRLKESFLITGKHLKNAYERFTEVEKELSMFEQQVKNIQLLEESIIKSEIKELRGKNEV